MQKQNICFMKEWVRLLKAILSHLRKHKKKEKTWSGIFCFAIPLKKEKCIPEKQPRPAYGQYYPHGWHRWSRNSRSGTEHELRGETMCSRKDLFFCQTKEPHYGIIQKNWVITWPEIILLQIYQETCPETGSFGGIPRNCNKSILSWKLSMVFPADAMIPLYVFSPCVSQYDIWSF